MKNIEDINNLKVKEIVAQKKHPEFFPGDIVKVGVKITEGKRDRIQYFEGVCIAKKNRDINSSFTVRKISFGEGVERTFALYSPAVSTIKVIRSGKVRRAKLYYLRDRTGKSARITEKIKKKIGIDLETKVQEVTEENVATSSNESLDNDTKKNEAKNTEASKVEAISTTEAPKVEVKKDNTKPLGEKEEPKKEVEPKK
tara:strand:- start:85 stop:681 length:597 start_codon:yes stop_codon:yes gene_type:complete